jgi:type IV pilus assembly protein PilC
MEFSYVAYTKDKKLVKGTLAASSGDAATKLLNYGGYQVLTVKPYSPFISLGRLSSFFNRVNPREIIMFSRQLALLLESGTDIVSSLELLQAQVTSKSLKQAIAEIVADIRGGSSLSAAMKKQPRMFSSIYARAISAGEQSGNLEIVLRQMAGFIERRVNTEKKVRSALTYPILVIIVAIAVVALMVTFVLPTFTQLYTQFSAEQPLATQMLIGLTDWLNDYGIYLLMGIFAAIGGGLIYLRTPAGRYQWDKLSFKLPIMGRVLLLYQLSRACRTISLLFKVGMPLPEVLSHTVRSAGNRAMAEQLQGVQDDLIRGEGLSKPMSRRPLFLPLMVQMVGVGEETGKLDNVLVTVAESYEMEADDRSSAAIGLIQPVVTIVIGLVIGFIALSLVSAMYSVYGQIQ